MVRIGVVGIGFMGMIHYYATKRIKGAKVVAICTRDPKKLSGDWTSIQGNFGPRGGMEDLSKIRKYNSIEEILKDKAIDLLDICLPTHLHKEVSLKGLKAGKHVLVEKPIAIALKDANEMVAAAERAKKNLMVGQVLPFFAEFAYAKKTIESGAYGRLLGAHFKRLTSKPAWSPDIADVSKSGGPGIDLHIHDTHFIQLVCGVPKQVYSKGILTTGGYVQYLTTQYIYEDKDLVVSCSSGGISQKGRAFTHGFEIYMEKATLLFEFATLGNKPSVSRPLTLLTSDGKVTNPKLKSSDPIDAFADEIQYAVDAIRKNQEPTALSGEGAKNALLLCYKEAESIKKGRAITVSA